MKDRRDHYGIGNKAEERLSEVFSPAALRGAAGDCLLLNDESHVVLHLMSVKAAGSAECCVESDKLVGDRMPFENKLCSG